MAKQFNVGDTVYFISSSVFVRKATVIRAAAGFVTIKFDTNNGNDGPSGIRVRESKMYHTEIGKDNSFSEINAKMLKTIALLAAMDSVYIFVAGGILFALGMSTGIVEVLILFVVFAGVVVTVAAAALSHLVYKAAAMKEENDLSI